MKCRATKDGKLISFGKIYINNPETIKVNDIVFNKVNNFVYTNEQYELFFSMAKKAYIIQERPKRTITYYRYLQVTDLSNNEVYYYKATGDDDLSQFEGQEGTPFEDTIEVSTPMHFVFKTLNNYVTDVDAVVESLRQRLSVIKGELWYQINYGIPLFEKKNKAFMDAAILGIINDHPAVANILNFQSNVKDKNYSFNCRIMTIYSAEISLNNNYSI